MLKSLWIKFLILLFVVSIIALSSALLLRELMIKDFREYLEGEIEDRVYWVMANLEGTYEKHSGWNKEVISENTIWALMMGLEIKIKDTNGVVVMDTENAFANLSPLIKRRITAISKLRAGKGTEEFSPYPLFLGGKEIGSLEVRFIRPKKEDIFIERSNRFLLVSLLGLGGLAIILSIIFSKKLTSPLKKLTSAAEGISKGNLDYRVKIKGSDEISKLSIAFNKMAESLKMQESLRKKLISNAAHELRTPLGAIRSELEGMIDGFISIDKEQLQSLYEETGRLKNILEGIEELSQAQASALSLRKQFIEIKPFLKNIIDRFSKISFDKGISIEIKCNEGFIIYADPDRLSQILINLLSNAIKATEREGRIWLNVGSKGSDDFIEIGDTGCGIKKEDLPFIFERFYRIPSIDHEGGLGLGLAIVKELVEAHKGRIEVNSEYGKGSVFTVYLPRYNLYNSS
jgi:two-component system sensor histidine kinase BaeS